MAAAFPDTMILTPTSRWPTRLPETTVQTVLSGHVPAARLSRPVADCPLASIIVVVLNNLLYNRLCLESVLVNTEYPNYEVIVVDNGSTDGTPEYLSGVRAMHPQITVVTNADNRGFAPAANQGLAAAAGDVLVLLNNDTVVPPGWLSRLVPHLRDRSVGLLGPLTNRAANEAQIEAGYHTYGEFLDFVRSHTAAHDGRTFDMTRLIMFCAAMRRDTYERIGPFDERFAVAMFEDDDYARRVRAAGYRITCAEDVFVHHFGQASIGHLAASQEYGALFEQNRARFEDKWTTVWESHHPRPRVEYEQLKDRLRRVVASHLPREAVALVASKGDDQLVDLPCQGWHFPQLAHGGYAGHHPADSADAIAQLEALRAKGGDFLVVPATMFWWFDHYREFSLHLEHHYCLLIDDPQTCKIFALRQHDYVRRKA